MDGLVNDSFCPSPFNVNVGSAPLALMAKKVGFVLISAYNAKGIPISLVLLLVAGSGVVAWKKIDW